jgi:DNA-3-methyladenine glycosylase II
MEDRGQPFAITGFLYPKAPFDFQQSLQFISGFQPTNGEQELTDSIITKAVSIRKIPIVFRLASEGDVDNPKISYTLYAKVKLAADILEEALDRIRFFLSMDDELISFYKLANKDEFFTRVVQKLYGYHQVKFLTPFENACWAILVQRNPIPLAQKLKRKLLERMDQNFQ